MLTTRQHCQFKPFTCLSRYLRQGMEGISKFDCTPQAFTILHFLLPRFQDAISSTSLHARAAVVFVDEHHEQEGERQSGQPAQVAAGKAGVSKSNAKESKESVSMNEEETAGQTSEKEGRKNMNVHHAVAGLETLLPLRHAHTLHCNCADPCSPGCVNGTGHLVPSPSAKHNECLTNDSKNSFCIQAFYIILFSHCIITSPSATVQTMLQLLHAYHHT